MPEQTLEDTKNFQFRSIPRDLHYKWKIISVFEGKSMEEIGLEAIAIHVTRLMKERKSELREVVEDSTDIDDDEQQSRSQS